MCWFKRKTKKPEVVNDYDNWEWMERIITSHIEFVRFDELEPSGSLHGYASLRSSQMNYNKKLSHKGFPDVALSLKQLGYRYPKEIIARGYDDPQQLVGAWLNSPSHRKILLNKKNKYIGVGVDGDFITVIFAR